MSRPASTPSMPAEFRAFECPDCGRVRPGPEEALALVIDCPGCESYQQYQPVSGRLVTDGGRRTGPSSVTVTCGRCGREFASLDDEEAHDCESERVDCRDCGFIGTWTTSDGACPECGSTDVVEGQPTEALE